MPFCRQTTGGKAAGERCDRNCGGIRASSVQQPTRHRYMARLQGMHSPRARNANNGHMFVGVRANKTSVRLVDSSPWGARSVRHTLSGHATRGTGPWLGRATYSWLAPMSAGDVETAAAATATTTTTAHGVGNWSICLTSDSFGWRQADRSIGYKTRTTSQ